MVRLRGQLEKVAGVSEHQVGEEGQLELYFGATSGEFLGSSDAGTSWYEVARRLPSDRLGQNRSPPVGP